MEKTIGAAGSWTSSLRDDAAGRAARRGILGMRGMLGRCVRTNSPRPEAARSLFSPMKLPAKARRR
jgi:hypothetical protein